MKKPRKHQKIKSKFTAIENHLLNTFFSGLYISSSELIEIGNSVDLTLDMNTRELLIKELLNKSDENERLSEVITLLNKVIDDRVQTYHKLSINYPGTLTQIARLAQKANSTKALLAREIRSNPYE